MRGIFFKKKGFKKMGNIEIQKSNGVNFLCSLTMMELIYIKNTMQCGNVNRLQLLSFVLEFN